MVGGEAADFERAQPVLAHFAPRARLSIQLKDMRIALATAEEIGFDAAITASFKKLHSDGIEHGLSDLDHSGLSIELANRNGMA